MQKALIESFVRFTEMVEQAREGDSQSIEILSEIGGYQIAIDEMTWGKEETDLTPKELESVAHYRRMITSCDKKLNALRNAGAAIEGELAAAHQALAQAAYQGKNGDENVYLLPAVRVVGKRVLIPDFTDMETGDYSNVKLKTYTRKLQPNQTGAALVFPLSGLWPF